MINTGISPVPKPKKRKTAQQHQQSDLPFGADEGASTEIVATNYHAFKVRERMELSRGGRSLLQGRGPDLTLADMHRSTLLWPVSSGLSFGMGLFLFVAMARHKDRIPPMVAENLSGVARTPWRQKKIASPYSRHKWT